MLCKIADLITEVPEAGGLAPRCQAYLIESSETPDILICQNSYRRDYYPDSLSESDLAYMESGRLFYAELIYWHGLMLHSSAIEKEGSAYLFSGPSGIGKSTHAHLWQHVFGDAVQVFNDDKPALRRLKDRWYAYGTPWCGKDGINKNSKVPLAGICFLKQSGENRIRRLSYAEALKRLIEQTIYLFDKAEKLDHMLMNLDCLIREIPVFEFENKPESEAVLMSYSTMKDAAAEEGL